MTEFPIDSPTGRFIHAVEITGVIRYEYDPPVFVEGGKYGVDAEGRISVEGKVMADPTRVIDLAQGRPPSAP